MALAVTWDGALFFTSKASSIGIANAVAVSTLMPVALIDKRAGNSNVLVDKALRRIDAINAPPTAPAAAQPTAAAVPAAPAAPAAASGSGGASSDAGSARASTTTVRGKKMRHEKQ